MYLLAVATEAGVCCLSPNSIGSNPFNFVVENMHDLKLCTVILSSRIYCIQYKTL